MLLVSGANVIITLNISAKRGQQEEAKAVFNFVQRSFETSGVNHYLYCRQTFKGEIWRKQAKVCQTFNHACSDLFVLSYVYTLRLIGQISYPGECGLTVHPQKQCHSLTNGL